MGAETAVNLEGLEPLCDEDEFADLIECMVAEFAPRLFAIVQEHGERVDGRIAAWGMKALAGFGWGGHVTARLVWVNLDARTPGDDAGSC